MRILFGRLWFVRDLKTFLPHGFFFLKPYECQILILTNHTGFSTHKNAESTVAPHTQERRGLRPGSFPESHISRTFHFRLPVLFSPFDCLQTNFECMPIAKLQCSDIKYWLIFTTRPICIASFWNKESFGKDIALVVQPQDTGSRV